MAELSSFFNAIKEENGTYDREYDASNWAEYFASFIGNGVFANPSNNLQVQSGTGLNVIVNTGKAWINGYYYNNTEPLTLALEASNPSYSRIDRVVCELNLNTREIKTHVLTGSFSSTPVAPVLETSSNIYQLSLAEIKVAPNATSVSQSSILDTRSNNDVCGFVAGIIDQIDTTNLFNQFTSAFDNWFATVKADYSSADISTILSDIKSIKNNSGNYLTASSSPTLSGSWTFNSEIYVAESGMVLFSNSNNTPIIMTTVTDGELYITNYNNEDTFLTITPSNTAENAGTIGINAPTSMNDCLNFIPNSGTAPTAGIQMNSSGEFIIYNNNTNNSVLGFTPVTSGADTLNIYSDVSTGYISSNNINVVDTLSTVALDIKESPKVNGTNLVNTAVNQSGIYTTPAGDQVNFNVNGWYCSPYLLTETTATDCGFLGVIGINLSNENGINISDGFTINLSGTPFANANLSTAMGINVPFIQTQATTTPMYISKITDSSITVSLEGSSAYIYETYIRIIITN